MESRYDIEEYIKSMMRTDEDMVSLLKAEMVWDYIESEWERAKGLEKVSEPIALEDDGQNFDLQTQEEIKAEDEEKSDAELLAELENL